MEETPTEIIKLICDFLECDIDFINLTMTCQLFYNCASLRNLTTEYPLSRILKASHHYEFTKIIYDSEKYDGTMKIPTNVHTIILSDTYIDILDHFYSHDKLKNIIISIFYNNLDSLPTIIDTINKNDIITSIITNVHNEQHYIDEFDELKNDNYTYDSLKLNNRHSMYMIKNNYYKKLLTKIHQKTINDNEFKSLRHRYYGAECGYYYALNRTNVYPHYTHFLRNFNVNDKSKENYEKLTELIKLFIDISNKSITYIKTLLNLIIKKYRLKDAYQYFRYSQTRHGVKFGRLKASSIEDLHNYSKGSCISYKNKSGEYSETGYLIEVGNDYYKYMNSLSYKSENMKHSKKFLNFVESHTFTVSIDDIAIIWIGDITKQNNIYVTETTKPQTIYPLIINDKIVHYFRNVHCFATYLRRHHYRSITWLKLFGV